MNRKVGAFSESGIGKRELEGEGDVDSKSGHTSYAFAEFEMSPGQHFSPLSGDKRGPTGNSGFERDWFLDRRSPAFNFT